MEELWSRSEDISLEYGASGVFQRRWQIMTYYVNEAYPGRLDTLAFSSPAIVVSDDGQSARGQLDRPSARRPMPAIWAPCP